MTFRNTKMVHTINPSVIGVFFFKLIIENDVQLLQTLSCSCRSCFKNFLHPLRHVTYFHQYWLQFECPSPSGLSSSRLFLKTVRFATLKKTFCHYLVLPAGVILFFVVGHVEMVGYVSRPGFQGFIQSATSGCLCALHVCKLTLCLPLFL